MTLAELQNDVHQLARVKGWWGERLNIGEKLALIHSEVSEALEEARLPNFEASAITLNPSGKPEGFAVELADAVIRIMDLAGGLGINLEEVIRLKHSFNAGRPFKHGKQF